MSHSPLPFAKGGKYESWSTEIEDKDGRGVAVVWTHETQLPHEPIEKGLANLDLIVTAVNHHDKLFNALADLCEWDARMGGHDSRAWDEARKVLNAIRDERDGQQPAPIVLQQADAKMIAEAADVELVSIPDELPELPNGELKCTCGCEEFRYVEEISNWRVVKSLNDGKLTVNAYYVTGEGYDDGHNPVLECRECLAQYAIPEETDVEFT